MRTKIKIAATALVILSTVLSAYSQDKKIAYYKQNDQSGVNMFEAPHFDTLEFTGLQVKIGGANTMQFQGISQSGDHEDLNELSPNFNLATANLDIDVQLHRGLRMHLRTYLSSRHHPEAWVKGGYIQVDRLDFIRDDFLDGLMDMVTIKVGHMQINYGDAHFRRSDNGQAIFNPFVGNYIMDSFTTEVGGEFYFQHNGFLVMVGLTNGKLNQSTVVTDPETKVSYVGKLGFDRQFNEDLRLRLTGSIYTSSQTPSLYLYSGDRAGSRYYDIIEDSRMSGRIAPDFSPRGVGGEMTSFMINPFIKYHGFELFGVFESASGKAIDEQDTRTYNQYAAELLYRFGNNENLYVGGRYNVVAGEQSDGNNINVERFNIGGGWFLTNNVLAKIEYVNQAYDGYQAGDIRENAKFSGIVLEAVVSF